jgi:hypothetical protein
MSVAEFAHGTEGEVVGEMRKSLQCFLHHSLYSAKGIGWQQLEISPHVISDAGDLNHSTYCWPDKDCS